MSNHPLLNIAVQAARRAGTVIIRALDRLEGVKVTPKGPKDFATEVDHKAETEIIQIIRKSYPDHSILGEEFGEQLGKDTDTLWIIDPLDGTTNFFHGFPHFCVSIAVMQKGRIEHGVIYDPLRQELFTASAGSGAKLNQYRLRVSNCLDLNSALVATSFPCPNVQSTRKSGSSALDLAYVAAGRLDGFWDEGLNAWDTAAGSLLITEAGGLISEPNGGTDYLKSGNLISTNPKLMDDFIKVCRR
ncbi:MAG TPA: inositol monophosphatase family protein [Gammaproteobacteria bacterium]|nr:inositol monophosphatase family protein [Gammaproteobacteria bacterium]